MQVLLLVSVLLGVSLSKPHTSDTTHFCMDAACSDPIGLASSKLSTCTLTVKPC